jgi:hypothetical protein
LVGMESLLTRPSALDQNMSTNKRRTAQIYTLFPSSPNVS